MVRTDGLALAGARGQRWLPDRPVQSIDDAARFVDDVGFALLFPTDRPTAPSLWEAVAGPDATPFAHGMGAAESMVWTWKDLLPEAGLAWYGRFIRRRASLLAPALLAALYPGRGEPDDHRAMALPRPRARPATTCPPLVQRACRTIVITGPVPSSTRTITAGVPASTSCWASRAGRRHRLVRARRAGPQHRQDRHAGPGPADGCRDHPAGPDPPPLARTG